MRFEPNPNDILNMFGERYIVQPMPSVPHIPYSSEGGRAFVYQLKDQKGVYFALKIFKRKFRERSLANTIQRLAQIKNFEGMRAANRRILSPDANIVRQYPELEYAMLMPWITGSTWYDVLINARDHGTYFSSSFAIKLSLQFLKVIAALELKGYAHSDISQGNLIVGQQHIDVQLLDLEDMYLPDASIPVQDYKGSPGYRHRSGDQGGTTWCPEGDRYAAAVMTAEMLLLTNKEAMRLATDTGFFVSHCQYPIGNERFDFARDLLAKTAPGFAQLFQQAWYSNSLADCPKIVDLSEALSESVASTTNKKITLPLPDVTGVSWVTLGNDQPIISPPLRVPTQTGQHGRTTTAVAGFWENQPKSVQVEKSLSDPQLPTVSPSSVSIWLIVIVITTLIIFLLWLSSRVGIGVHNNIPSSQATLSSQLTQKSVSTPSATQSIEAMTSSQTKVTNKEEQVVIIDTERLEVSAIDGSWLVSINNHDSTLTIKNGIGQLVTTLPYFIDQEVVAMSSPRGFKGIVLKGLNPVLAETKIRLSNYAADEILFMRQADGAFKVWTRDNINVKDWEAFLVKSFKPDFNGEESNREYLTTNDIAGVWEFSNFSRNNHMASLAFRGDHGLFRTLTIVNVTQQALAKISDQGIHVRCSDPTLSEEGVRAPNFSPDELLFQKQTDGTFRVFQKDDVNIKDWTILSVKSHQ